MANRLPGLTYLDDVGAFAAAVGADLERRWSTESGPLGGICRYALTPVGKLFRPALLLDSALAVGGSFSAVLPAAVGAECGHVASLIHDDIVDDDHLRRGRTSVHHRYGVGDAIIAGDALIFDLFASLAECRRTGVPDGQVVSALEAVTRAGLDLCRGQILEAELGRSVCLDTDAYLRMIALKTAAYFRGACECGAILGGGQPELVDALAEYGERLGLAFQIHDDLLPYISDARVTGKPDTSDVRNGRLTLPVILAYQAGTRAEQRLVRESVTAPGDPEQTLVALHEIAERTGALTAARAMARRCADESRRALELLPATPSRERLGLLTEAVLTRDR